MARLQGEYDAECERLRSEHDAKMATVAEYNGRILAEVDTSGLATLELGRVQRFWDHIRSCSGKMAIGVNFQPDTPNLDRVVEMSAVTDALRAAFPELEPHRYPWPEHERRGERGAGWSPSPRPKPIGGADPTLPSLRVSHGSLELRRDADGRPLTARPATRRPATAGATVPLVEAKQGAVYGAVGAAAPPAVAFSKNVVHEALQAVSGRDLASPPEGPRDASPPAVARRSASPTFYALQAGLAGGAVLHSDKLSAALARSRAAPAASAAPSAPASRPATASAAVGASHRHVAYGSGARPASPTSPRSRPTTAPAGGRPGSSGSRPASGRPHASAHSAEVPEHLAPPPSSPPPALASYRSEGAPKQRPASARPASATRTRPTTATKAARSNITPEAVSRALSQNRYVEGRVRAAAARPSSGGAGI